MKPEWILPDLNIVQIDALSKNTGINKNILSILYSRGIKNEDEIVRFLYPELNNLYSPFLLHDIYNAIERLKSAIKKGEKIAIFGDSDLDGITSMTIMYDMLSKAGCTPLIRYPKAKESYGLTIEVIDEFIKEQVNLVITVDSGIRDIQEINYGKKNGIDFIITDHHEPDLIYPDAIIVNPKKRECEYPFKELAGVGVAFKFVQAFLYSYTSGFNKNFVLIYKNSNSYSFRIIKNSIITGEINAVKDDVVPVLTSDIGPSDFIVFLNEESMSLASIIKSIYPEIKITDIKKIASVFNNTNYPNNKIMLNKLTSEFRIDSRNKSNEFDLYTKLFIEFEWRSSIKIITILQEYVVLVTIGTIADIMPLHGENRQLVKYGLSLINRGEGHNGIISLAGKSQTTSKSISWDIAPLLNAPGRMGETDLTVNFFLEKDINRIGDVLAAIHKTNRERKKLVLEIIEKIKNDTSVSTLNDNIFFYMHEEIIDGLAGLIANRLADDLKKPVIIATGADKNGIIKGSARSSGKFDFFKYTAPASHLFERVGGHAQAFGFTAELKNIHEIVKIINESIASNFIPDKQIHIDAIIEIGEINHLYIKSMSLLEPFGKNNEEPIYAARSVKIDSFSKFGVQKNHGKYIINKTLQAIGWNMFEKMGNYFDSEKYVDIIFKLENNEYQGKVFPRLILIDIDFSE